MDETYQRQVPDYASYRARLSATAGSALPVP